MLKVPCTLLVDNFLVHELYLKHRKKLVRSDVVPLTCHVCKKELNGISITAKILDGKMVFLCAHHYTSKPNQVVLVKLV